MTRHIACCAALVASLAVCGAATVQQLTHGEADSLERKLTAVVARGSAAKPAGKGTPVRTSVSEREVNAYLKFNAKDQIPKGVVDPQVTLAGERRVSGRAIVDLDAIRTAQDRSWLDPAAYLTGSLELRATGLLQTANGKGTLQIESATIGGVPVPKSLLQELISHYSKSTDLPAGFDLDKPFDLPANIREVDIQRGAATIVQ